MVILDKQISTEELASIAEKVFGDMVKAVVNKFIAR